MFMSLSVDGDASVIIALDGGHLSNAAFLGVVISAERAARRAAEFLAASSTLHKATVLSMYLLRTYSTKKGKILPA